MLQSIQSVQFLFLLVILLGIQACSDSANSSSQELEAPTVQEMPDVQETSIAPARNIKKTAQTAIDTERLDTTKQENTTLVSQAEGNNKVEEEKKKPVEKKKPKKRPKIKFEEKIHNFGLLMEGDEIEHSFQFKNTGNADLVIKSATATCGCTTPSYPFIPIKPGESGKIDVTYNSKGKLGSQKPMITVVTNARPRTYKLFLEGVVDTERAGAAKTTTETDTL